MPGCRITVIQSCGSQDNGSALLSALIHGLVEALGQPVSWLYRLEPGSMGEGRGLGLSGFTGQNAILGTQGERG